MTNDHDSPDEIIIKLKKLIKKIEHGQTETECGGVTHAQVRIVFPIIRDGKGYSMQELSETVGVDKALVSRTITHLEDKGFVERDKKEGSIERNYKILLTEKGRRFFAEKKAQVKETFKKRFGDITMEELRIFKKVLDKLTID